MLALSHTEAFIWPYNASSTTPAYRELFAFRLPLPVPSPTEPLPIGAFASGSVGNEPGIVVVIPGKGKIIYWETISSASSLLPGQKSNGLEGSIPGMFSGESVINIVNAEPAGFILTFNHGRVAHLTVRDQLGRPAIGVQYLRKVPTGHSGGIFGSIRNVFGGSGRKDRPSIAVGSASKSQRNVVIACEDGELEFWDVRANVGNSLKFQVNMRQEILDELRDGIPYNAHESYRFKLLDISLGAAPGNAVQRSDETSSTLVTQLISLSSQNEARYFLIETLISEESSSVIVSHPVKCYNEPLEPGSTWMPKLSIPKPYSTAFVIFENAVVLFSLARIRESPSSQLQSSLPEPFQDVIKFKRQSPFRVLGLGTEDQSGASNYPSCVLSIQGFGVIRYLSTLSQTVEPDAQTPAKITTRSRIEQAVFFGTVRNSPLDLSSGANQQVSPDEVENAALEICEEVLQSTSKFLPKLSSSLDQQFRLRCKAIEDLATHVNRRYKPISRSAKFRLLAGAERLAAQRAMWKVEEECRKRTPKGEDTLFDIMLVYVAQKTNMDTAKGDTDQTRLWFARDTTQIDVVLIWLSKVFELLGSNEQASDCVIGEYLSQAQDLFIGAYEGAFRFREDNALTFGLGDEHFKEGVLTTGYKGITEPWTSDKRVVLQHRTKLYSLLSDFLGTWWEQSKIRDPQNPRRETVVRMGQHFRTLVDLLIRVIDERTRYCSETENSSEAKFWRKANLEVRRTSMYQMAGIGFNRNATDLAEKLHDMEALNELICSMEEQVESQLLNVNSPSDKLRLEKERSMLEKRVEGYFSTYGDDWAHARFGRMVQVGSLGSLLEKADDNRQSPFLEHFLRQEPGYDRIRWISETLGNQQDYASVYKTLQNAAAQEQDLWNKKVELCIGNLARLAAEEESTEKDPTGRVSSTPQAANEAANSRFNAELALLHEQEKLRDHVSFVLGDEMDKLKDPEMKTENAIRTIGSGQATQGKPAFAGLLAHAIRRVIEGRALSIDQLVDFLTLMTASGGIFEAETVDSEFATALHLVDETANSGIMYTPRGGSAPWEEKNEALSHVIWRRAMLADDWKTLNQTEGLIDDEVIARFHATKLFRTMTILIERDLIVSNDANATADPAQPSSTSFSADRKSLHQVNAFPTTSASRPRPQFPSPTQIVEAESFPEVLQRRFRPEEREIVAQDFEAEQEALKELVAKARLQERWEGLMEEAVTAVFGGEAGDGEIDGPLERVVGEVRGKDGGGEVVNGDGDVEMEEVK